MFSSQCLSYVLHGCPLSFHNIAPFLPTARVLRLAREFVLPWESLVRSFNPRQFISSCSMHPCNLHWHLSFCNAIAVWQPYFLTLVILGWHHLQLMSMRHSWSAMIRSIVVEMIQSECSYLLSLWAHALVDNVAITITTSYNKPLRLVEVIYFYSPELYQQRWIINPVFHSEKRNQKTRWAYLTWGGTVGTGHITIYSMLLVSGLVSENQKLSRRY